MTSAITHPIAQPVSNLSDNRRKSAITMIAAAILMSTAILLCVAGQCSILPKNIGWITGCSLGTITGLGSCILFRKTPLLRAVEQKKEGRIQQLLATNADPNSVRAFSSVLDIACAKANADIVSFLVDQGATIDTLALKSALKNKTDKEAIVKTLLQKGAKLDSGAFFIIKRAPELAPLFIEYGYTPSQEDLKFTFGEMINETVHSLLRLLIQTSPFNSLDHLKQDFSGQVSKINML